VEKCEKFRALGASRFSGRESATPRRADRGRGRVLTACSACAGDYEDPDRTAWPVHEVDEDEAQGDETHDERGAIREEFPAQD